VKLQCITLHRARIPQVRRGRQWGSMAEGLGTVSSWGRHEMGSVAVGQQWGNMDVGQWQGCLYATWASDLAS